MLKVLHLIHYPGKGGTERYILSLAEKLHGSRCEFFLGYSADGPLVENMRKLGIKAFNIPMVNPLDFRAAKMVKDICGELGIDLVHTHFLREKYVSIFSRLMGNKVKLVTTCHLIDKKNMLLQFSNLVMSLFTDGNIAVSHAVRDQMAEEGIDPRLVTVIHNGVDAGFWKGRRNYVLRKEFGLEKEDFVVTSVARFSEEKGHMFLLESISQLKKMASYRNIAGAGRLKFLLVGDGELLEECKNMAGMLGISANVVFTGYRSDIKAILHTSDLYVSHSSSEAFGISILEALASGVPVVATRVGGSVEVMEEGNNCGMMVEYNDTEALAGAILKLLTEKEFYEFCKKNTVNTVEEKFNLDKMAEETYNLYKYGSESDNKDETVM